MRNHANTFTHTVSKVRNLNLNFKDKWLWSYMMWRNLVVFCKSYVKLCSKLQELLFLFPWELNTLSEHEWTADEYISTAATEIMMPPKSTCQIKHFMTSLTQQCMLKCYHEYFFLSQCLIIYHNIWIGVFFKIFELFSLPVNDFGIYLWCF